MTVPRDPAPFDRFDRFDRFTVDDFSLDSGTVLPRATLAWAQRGTVGHGEPVLTCSAFGATPADLAWLSAPGGPLDPAERWLIHCELLANGRSSSPSNTPPPFDGPRFPRLSVRDNVRLQMRLLDHLGVPRLHAAVGASMGGAVALQWAVSAPARVGRAAVIAGNARTTLYGQLFLHTVRSALCSDPAWAGGGYRAPPLLGLTRMSETWAAFALSPRFFSTGAHQAHADLAAPDLAGFLARWGTRYHTRDANDLLSHLDTWFHHDVGDAVACAGCPVPLLFLPVGTDLYFHPDDVREQAAAFSNARVEVIDSLSGHAAAFGRTPQDREAVAQALRGFLG